MTMRLIAALLFTFFTLEAHASCDYINSNISDVTRYFKRASQESDFENAKYQMRRVSRSLDDVSSNANDCGCTQASSEFDDAARKAKRASNAFDYDEYKENFTKTIRYYNNGIEYLNNCGK